MDVGPVGTGESKVKGIVLLRGKFIISVVGSNELSSYVSVRILNHPLYFIRFRLHSDIPGTL